jgi:hypothetical protein
MEDDTGPERLKPANDNIGERDAEKPSAETWDKIDRVALTLARIIGRRMAREDLERHRAANDNRPIASGTTEDGADQE